MTIGTPNRLTLLARLWRGLTSCASGEAAETAVDTADEAGDDDMDGDFEEAGGIFTDWEGKASIHVENGVAANPALHREVLQILGE